jgi:hypothetical protein
MLQDLILIGAISSACWEKNEKEKEKKKKKRSGWRLFPRAQARHSLLVCQPGFSQLLGALKADLRVSL